MRYDLDTRQEIVADWVDELNLGSDHRTRALRLLEEAAEAVQAAGLSHEDQLHVINVVNSRPPGEVGQEVGGVMVTLFAFADVNEVSVQDEMDLEIIRIHTPEVMEKCRRRQVEKRAQGL